MDIHTAHILYYYKIVSFFFQIYNETTEEID
jgi:hypothetical protein